MSNSKSHIEKTVSIDALLVHPVFWTRHKTREFLWGFSNLLADGKLEQSLKDAFEMSFHEVVSQVHWIHELDHNVRVYFEKEYFKRNKKENSLFCLLRGVRNVINHFHQIYSLETKNYFGDAEIQQNNDNHDDQENQGQEEDGKLPDVFADKLAPYFGHTPDDTIVYWVHKFPRLLPICYAFAHSKNFLRNGENFYLVDNENAELGTNQNYSSFSGVFNELYFWATQITQHDKLLGQYTTRSSSGSLKIYKIHPWALGDHQLIVIEHLPGRVVLTKQKHVEKSEKSAKPNIIRDNPCFETSGGSKRRKLRCSCGCTKLWACERMEFKSSTLDHHNNLLVLLCDNIEIGLKKAYWNDQRQWDTQSVVIFTKNSYIEVEESMRKFQKMENSISKCLKFYKVGIKWAELSKPYQDELLEKEVRFQNNPEILRDLVDLQPTILNNLEGDLLLKLIHAGKGGAPQLIKNFDSLPNVIVEITRTLTHTNRFEISNLKALQQSIKTAEMSSGDQESKNPIGASIKTFTNEQKHFEDLQKTETKQVRAISETELTQDNKKSRSHCIISAESGMGKSTLLHRLARELTTNLPLTSIVGLLRFPDIVKALPSANVTNVVTNEVTKEGVSKVIAEGIASSSICGSLVSPIIISGKYPIFLLLDAIDEVATMELEYCLRVLELIHKEFIHVTLYVTTRKENLQKVQTALQSLDSYTLEPLDNLSRGKFLTRYYWQQWSIATEKPISDLEKYLRNPTLTDECIDQTNANLFGSPIWLCRLAQIYLKSTSHTGSMKRFTNRTELNNEFIRTNMSTAYSKEYEAEGKGQVNKLSVLYTMEKQEMLAVYEDSVEQTQSHFQIII